MADSSNWKLNKQQCRLNKSLWTTRASYTATPLATRPTKNGPWMPSRDASSLQQACLLQVTTWKHIGFIGNERTYKRNHVKGGEERHDDGGLGGRCDDVVISHEHGLMLVDHQPEKGRRLEVITTTVYASDRNSDAQHGDDRKLQLARQNVIVLLHGTLGGLYRN